MEEVDLERRDKEFNFVHFNFKILIRQQMRMSVGQWTMMRDSV